MKSDEQSIERIPGWERISWDEALDLTADKLKQIAETYGPQSVVFTMASPSTSATADSMDWIAGATVGSCTMAACHLGRDISGNPGGTAVPGGGNCRVRRQPSHCTF